MQRDGSLPWVLAILLALALFWFGLGAVSASRIAPERSMASWRQGEIPAGLPVIGLWKHHGELVVIPVLMTDYSGLYEYTLIEGRAIRKLPDPDWWVPLPGVDP